MVIRKAEGSFIAESERDMIQVGDILVAVNGTPVVGEDPSALYARVLSLPIPMSLTFHNPSAVDAEDALAAENPRTCTVFVDVLSIVAQ